MPSLLPRPALPAFMLMLACLPVLAQTQRSVTGQVADRETGKGLAFVNVGVVGKPVGTVSDEEGRFSLALADSLNRDSVRISLLGYAPLTVKVTDIRFEIARGDGKLLLQPAPVKLKEVTVRPGSARLKVVGNSGNGTTVTCRFKVNQLGNQLGQAMRLKRPSYLEQVSFHIAHTTYDSLFYRVNVYQLEKGQPGRNLLPEPVYVKVEKGQIKDRFVADLRKYNVLAQGDILVALETIKDLGPGNLELTCVLLKGPLYHTVQKEGRWEKVGGFGVGIDATVLEMQK